MLAHLLFHNNNNSKELDTYRYSASVAIDIASVAIDIDIVAIAIASIDIAIANIAIGLWFLYIHAMHPRLD